MALETTQQTAYRSPPGSAIAEAATARREWPAEAASGAVPAGRPTGSAAGLHPRVSTAALRLTTAVSAACYAVLLIFLFVFWGLVDNSFSIHNNDKSITAKARGRDQ
ncbi:hypothetical protein VTN02DRAFT_3007 [Thermoascus thermophilus]